MVQEQASIGSAARPAWRLRMGRLILYPVVIVLAVIFGFPLFWTLMSSLKTVPELFEFPPRVLPRSPQLSNYWQVFVAPRMPVARWLLNSAVVAVLSTVGTVIACSLVAYSFARFEYRGRNTLFLITLATLILPAQVTLIPRFVLFYRLNWSNTLLPLWVPQWFGGAFGIFMPRQFFLSIPRDLDEPKPGWNFADWEKLARAAADKDKGIFGLAFESIEALHYYSNISRSFGEPGSTDGWVMDREGKKFNYATPLHKEIAAWLVGLLKDKVLPGKADYIENASGNLFNAGLSATYAGITGSVADAKAKIGGKFEMDAILLPVGPKGRRGSCYSGNQYMVNAKSQRQKEAYNLLKLFSSKKVQAILDQPQA